MKFLPSYVTLAYVHKQPAVANQNYEIRKELDDKKKQAELSYKAKLRDKSFLKLTLRVNPHLINTGKRHFHTDPLRIE
jgi:hypothetical protein